MNSLRCTTNDAATNETQLDFLFCLNYVAMAENEKRLCFVHPVAVSHSHCRRLCGKYILCSVFGDKDQLRIYRNEQNNCTKMFVCVRVRCVIIKFKIIWRRCSESYGCHAQFSITQMLGFDQIFHEMLERRTIPQIKIHSFVLSLGDNISPSSLCQPEKPKCPLLLTDLWLYSSLINFYKTHSPFQRRSVDISVSLHTPKCCNWSHNNVLV